MRFLGKILIIFCILIGNIAFADTILVLPTDLYSENYYSFPEVSEIIAQDVTDNLNVNKHFTTINIYDVRKKINSDQNLKSSIIYGLNKYKNTDSIDFSVFRKTAQAFNVKSIILISSVVKQESLRRSVWEVLEISSAFDAISKYKLETNVVLLDNVNDLVMWSGKYERVLGDNEDKFWAKSSAEALSQLEKLKMYSKNIVSRNITQNVILRIYPKSRKQVKVIKKKEVDYSEFKPNPLENVKHLIEPKVEDIEIEDIYSF